MIILYSFTNFPSASTGRVIAPMTFPPNMVESDFEKQNLENMTDALNSNGIVETHHMEIHRLMQKQLETLKHFAPDEMLKNYLQQMINHIPSYGGIQF
jgi:hypothetical protein